MQKSQYQRMFELEDTHFWFLSKREFIKAFLPSHATGLKILDMGCGTGGFSRFLSRFGQVERIEKSANAIKYLKRRKLPFIKGDIQKIKLKNSFYDLVCIIDVLYHRSVKSESGVLKRAYQTLRSGGMLLIIDSALPFLYSHHDDLQHARKRYYLEGLAKILRSEGFKIEKKSYIYFFLFPIFLIVRLINKFYRFNDLKPVHPIINNLFLNICRFEASLLKFLTFPIGSTVIILSIKP